MSTTNEATAAARAFRESDGATTPYRLPIGTKILIVDDVVDIQTVLKFFLEFRGAVVLTADNGLDAVELALKEKPDLILMDMKLPEGMNGYVATRSLRGNGYDHPIIAMTGLASQSDRDLCFRAGCSDYLKKPVDLNQLLLTLKRHL